MNQNEKKISIFQQMSPGKILLLALAGILLLVTSLPQGDKISSGKAGEPTEKSEEDVPSNEEYITTLENKLKHILENVDGVGQVEVMITLKSSGESILNKDLKEESATEEENDGETEKNSLTRKKEEETILADGSGESAPYVIKQMKPEISGVIISCEGADSNRVAADIMQAVQALFDLSSNHIKILKMEEKQ